MAEQPLLLVNDPSSQQQAADQLLVHEVPVTGWFIPRTFKFHDKTTILLAAIQYFNAGLVPTLIYTMEMWMIEDMRIDRVYIYRVVNFLILPSYFKPLFGLFQQILPSPRTHIMVGAIAQCTGYAILCIDALNSRPAFLIFTALLLGIAQAYTEVAVHGVMVIESRKNTMTFAADLFSFAWLFQAAALFGYFLLILLNRYWAPNAVLFPLLAIPSLAIAVVGCQLKIPLHAAMDCSTRCKTVCCQNFCGNKWFAQIIVFVLVMQLMPTWNYLVFDIEVFYGLITSKEEELILLFGTCLTFGSFWLFALWLYKREPAF